MKQLLTILLLLPLCVPLLTEAQIKNDTGTINRIIRMLRISTVLYAACTTVELLIFSHFIALYLFHTPEAAHYIRLLAMLVPIMNLDTITDGALRGLGQQQRVMRINILDALLGVALVMLLIPHFGLIGYILMIWTTECINCLLSTIALQISQKEKPRQRTPHGRKEIQQRTSRSADSGIPHREGQAE